MCEYMIKQTTGGGEKNTERKQFRLSLGSIKEKTVPTLAKGTNLLGQGDIHLN